MPAFDARYYPEAGEGIGTAYVRSVHNTPPNTTGTNAVSCEACHGSGSEHFGAGPIPQFAGTTKDCAKCHNAQVFCRGCHVQTGLASSGRLDAAYHTAQPQWLLQHGRAARQGLQSCTTCHTQKDCMQCHSQAGWGVSPHGPDFDAKAMSKRAKSQCFRCHITDPLAGR